MIVLNLPQPEPPEIPPRRRRLMVDLANVETILRAMDLNELQDAIDEGLSVFPEWRKTAAPLPLRGAIYSLTGQQIILLAAVELLRARKELPFPKT